MPRRNVLAEYAAIAVKQEFFRFSGDKALHQAHGPRPAHKRMKKSDIPPPPVNSIYGDRAASPQRANLLRMADLFQNTKGFLLECANDDLGEIFLLAVRFTGRRAAIWKSGKRTAALPWIWNAPPPWRPANSAASRYINSSMRTTVWMGMRGTPAPWAPGRRPAMKRICGPRWTLRQGCKNEESRRETEAHGTWSATAYRVPLPFFLTFREIGGPVSAAP